MLVVFFGTLFFMVAIVFGTNKLGYKKAAKYIAISFLSIICLFGIFLMYSLITSNGKSKAEIVEILGYTNLKLNNDFEIVKQNEDWDLTFSKINFTLKLSNIDYLKLKKQYPNNILRDSISHDNPDDYDTLKVKIDQNKNLYFYRAHHNFDN